MPYGYIDVERWDPEHDPFLPRPYSADDLSGKDSAKAEVLVRYRLATDGATLKRPLVAMISRMIDQKGFDLMAALADELPRLEATFIVLGTGETRYQDLWTGLAARHPDRIGAHIGFDEALAHLIEAGADIFLMPSKYEPCGLNQIYSLKYGTIPVVRATGGLDDTIENYDPATGAGTGFKFVRYDAREFLEAIGRAVRLFADREAWEELMRNAMGKDFSWEVSARKYIQLYKKIIK